MKKNKLKKILIIVLLVVILCGYFGYKGYNYLIYSKSRPVDIDYDKFMNSFEIHNNMKINKNNIKEENYIIYKNVRIRNDFTNYTITYDSEEGRTYRLIDDKEKTIAVFKIGVKSQLVDSDLDDYWFNEEDKNNFFKKYNISNDSDLLDFVLEKHNVKNNIFTSIKNMKEHAIIEYFTSVMLGNPTYVTKLEGDYNGYLVEKEKGGQSNPTFKNINTVTIFKDNKLYYFSFWLSDKFTEEYIKEIIETVVIEKNDIDTFVRTYQVLDIIEIPENNKSQIILKQFQSDEEVKVEVYNSFANNMKKNKYYEFTFQKNTNNVEDNIKSIFENRNLLSVNLTDKEGLDQKNDIIK